MASRTADDFLVLAGASASRRRPGTGKAAWVAEDRCVEAKVKVRRGKVDIASTGSRRSSGGSVRRLFSRARGRFRTRGRHGAATVRGRAIVGR